MGTFSYPCGMAGTMRIQNVIRSLKQYPNISTRVILQRQSTEQNILSGVHEGTPYETVMGDVLRSRMFLVLPLLYYRTTIALKRAFLPDQMNVIYFYGPLFLESIVPLRCAQRLGYKIIFDVIEDYSLTKGVSRSSYQYVRSVIAHRLSSEIRDMSSGIIAISTYLEMKYKQLTLGRVPVHYLPVSVDMDRFRGNPDRRGRTIALFYAGSFGKKDGLPVLLDAFDRLAARHDRVRLVLTGRGDSTAMKEFFARMSRSPHRHRIEFKGYLNEEDYYSLLNDAAIPCMTRADLPFAHAGFPFKLGEFLATGNPVIASRVSDVDRFLVHGHNAMLVHPGSSSEICEAAEFLINNPESAAAIGARGRETARLHFDYKQQGKALLEYIESL